MTKNPSLAETNPEIAKQWHPTLNGDLTPRNVTPGCGKDIWWKCEKETKNDSHLYKTTIVNRVMGVACPMCHTINIKKKMRREGFNYDNLVSRLYGVPTTGYGKIQFKARFEPYNSYGEPNISEKIAERDKENKLWTHTEMFIKYHINDELLKKNTFKDLINNLPGIEEVCNKLVENPSELNIKTLLNSFHNINDKEKSINKFFSNDKFLEYTLKTIKFYHNFLLDTKKDKTDAYLFLATFYGKILEKKHKSNTSKSDEIHKYKWRNLIKYDDLTDLYEKLVEGKYIYKTSKRTFKAAFSIIDKDENDNVKKDSYKKIIWQKKNNLLVYLISSLIQQKYIILGRLPRHQIALEKRFEKVHLSKGKDPNEIKERTPIKWGNSNSLVKNEEHGQDSKDMMKLLGLELYDYNENLH